MITTPSVRELQSWPAWLKGALAGLIATGPMTIFMLATQRLLPRGQRYALPPEMITGQLAQRAHLRWRLNKPQLLVATLVSHFGYGAAAGAIYGPLEKQAPLSPPLKGLLFGLLIWAGSYLALLPMLGISASGQKEPGRRNLLMIAAHVVWGTALGGGVAALRNARRNIYPG